VADLFTGEQSGSWTVGGGAFDAVPDAAEEIGYATVDLGLGSGLSPNSYLELGASVQTAAAGGIFFDGYGDGSFKFVVLDVAAQQVLIGHQELRKGWVVESAVDRPLVPGEDYAIELKLKGTSVSILVDGQMVASHGYNAPVVDGAFGLLSRGGPASFDDFSIKTNDPVFEGENLLAPSVVSQVAGTEVLTDEQLAPIAAQAIQHWSAVSSIDTSSLAAVQFEIADLPAMILGQAGDTHVWIDVTAAGYGWSLDGTPDADEVDLLTVVLHELGHVLGMEHSDDRDSLMYPSIVPGAVQHNLGEYSSNPAAHPHDHDAHDHGPDPLAHEFSGAAARRLEPLAEDAHVGPLSNPLPLPFGQAMSVDGRTAAGQQTEVLDIEDTVPPLLRSRNTTGAAWLLRSHDHDRALTNTASPPLKAYDELVDAVFDDYGSENLDETLLDELTSATEL
jgi:hypothetical protein